MKGKTYVKKILYRDICGRDCKGWTEEPQTWVLVLFAVPGLGIIMLMLYLMFRAKKEIYVEVRK